MAPTLQFSLGLEDLTLVSAMSAFGSTRRRRCCSTPRTRSRAGRRTSVACVYADAPLTRGRLDLAVGLRRQSASARPGFAGLRFAYGDYGPANSMYALALRRHMHLFGTDHDQLGTIAVGQREWALMNPRAQMRKPMTLEDYHASRWVVEPLHLLDCCLVSNGAVAVIVTSAERARDLRQPPVYLRGFGQCAPGDTGAGRARAGGPHRRRRRSGELALRQAGIELADVDVLELYDCYTYTVLVTLEDYGFCAKGEGGAFVADGKLGPGGSLPLQHRRRPALVVLHVGLHAAVGGRDPGARPGRRAPGREARPRARQRQRRRPELPLDHDPQQARR